MDCLKNGNDKKSLVTKESTSTAIINAESMSGADALYTTDSNGRTRSTTTTTDAGELMDVALAQQRVPIFIPISKEHVQMLDKWDRLNITTIIHPFSTFRFCWDSFIMVIIIFTMFEIPLTLSFGIETGDIHTRYGAFVLTIDLCLCIDLITNFRTGYFHKHDELRLISDPRRIAKRYLCGWFFIDFLTSFPFEFVTPRNVDLGGAPALIRALRVLRLVRLFKLVRFFRLLKLVNSFLREFMGPTASLILTLCRLILFMMIAAHSAACLWYYVGSVHYDDPVKGSWLNTNNVDPNNIYEAYLVSMYWSIVTLFTTGYGDITPVNKDEQMVAAAVILLGTMCFAYLIGAVGSLVAEGDRARSVRMSKYEEAQAFCANKRLPPQLARAIMTHVTYFWKRNFVYDDQDVLQSLPYGIQYDVLKFTGRQMFGDFAPFENLPMTTKGLLALRLKQFSCNKGFPVYRHGDVAKEFFIQRTGRSCLVVPFKTKKSKSKDIPQDDDYKENHNGNATDYEVEEEVFEEQVTLHRSLSYIPYFESKDNVDHNQRVTSSSLSQRDGSGGREVADHIGLSTNPPSISNRKLSREKTRDLDCSRVTKVLSLGDLKGRNYRLRRGDVAGHSGFVKGTRNGTLYCETWSEFYSLSRRDLEEVLCLEHPNTYEQLMKEILHSLKSYKPRRSKKSKSKSNATMKQSDGTLSNRLVVDLDSGRKRTQSKIVRFFTEDSVQRNSKILHEMIPSSDTVRGEALSDIEMTEMNGDDSNYDDELQRGNSSSSGSSTTSDSDDVVIWTNSGGTSTNRVARKGGGGGKRKKIGKQGGGGGNRGGGGGGGGRTKKPTIVPMREPKWSSNDDRNRDRDRDHDHDTEQVPLQTSIRISNKSNSPSLPPVNSGIQTQPTNETVTATTATVTTVTTISTGKATVNSSDTEREAANREAFGDGDGGGGGGGNGLNMNYVDDQMEQQPVIRLITPSISTQGVSQESHDSGGGGGGQFYDNNQDIVGTLGQKQTASRMAPASRSRDLAPQQSSATAVPVETKNRTKSRVAQGSPRTMQKIGHNRGRVASNNDSDSLWQMAEDVMAQNKARRRGKSKETVLSDTTVSVLESNGNTNGDSGGFVE